MGLKLRSERIASPAKKAIAPESNLIDKPNPADTELVIDSTGTISLHPGTTLCKINKKIKALKFNLTKQPDPATKKLVEDNVEVESLHSNTTCRKKTEKAKAPKSSSNDQHDMTHKNSDIDHVEVDSLSSDTFINKKAKKARAPKSNSADQFDVTRQNLRTDSVVSDSISSDASFRKKAKKIKHPKSHWIDQYNMACIMLRIDGLESDTVSSDAPLHKKSKKPKTLKSNLTDQPGVARKNLEIDKVESVFSVAPSRKKTKKTKDESNAVTLGAHYHDIETINSSRSTNYWSPTTNANSIADHIESNQLAFGVAKNPTTGEVRSSIGHAIDPPSYTNMVAMSDYNEPNLLSLDTFHHKIVEDRTTTLLRKVDYIQDMLYTIVDTQKKLLEAQQKLQDSQDEVKKELQSIKQQNLAYESREKWLVENGINLPIKSMEEFTRYCTLLEQSSECRKILETSVHFAVNGKKSLTKNIALVVRKYFSREVASQFTAIKFVKEKTVLAGTAFYKHLLKNFLEKSAAGVILSGLNESDFNKALGEVLCNAKDWNRKRLAQPTQ